jgi:hypothetical protein
MDPLLLSNQQTQEYGMGTLAIAGQTKVQNTTSSQKSDACWFHGFT